MTRGQALGYIRRALTATHHPAQIKAVRGRDGRCWLEYEGGSERMERRTLGVGSNWRVAYNRAKQVKS